MIKEEIFNIISKFSSYCKKNQKTIDRLDGFLLQIIRTLGSLYLFIFLIFLKIQKKIILINLNLFVLLLGFDSTNSTLGYMSSRIIKNGIEGNYVTGLTGNDFERCDFSRTS